MFGYFLLSGRENQWQWVQLDLSEGLTSTQPLALPLCQTWLFPGTGMFEAEAHCPEQPLTEGHKHGAKGKGTTLVLAQAWICLTPGSSMDVSDLQPCRTCLYNPSLLCAICFPFGRLAIRDSMLKLVSP